MVNELNLLVIFYQSKTIAYENIEAFEKVAEAVSNKLLPGQEDIEIQTKSAILTCRRVRTADLSISITFIVQNTRSGQLK